MCSGNPNFYFILSLREESGRFVRKIGFWSAIDLNGTESPERDLMIFRKSIYQSEFHLSVSLV